jgi:hypothetical protein
MDSIIYIAPQNSMDHINRYNNVHFPLSKVMREKAWKKSNASFNQKLMNNNAKMRKHHQIKQPGFDVQRR